MNKIIPLLIISFLGIKNIFADSITLSIDPKLYQQTISFGITDANGNILGEECISINNNTGPCGSLHNTYVEFKPTTKTITLDDGKSKIILTTSYQSTGFFNGCNYSIVLTSDTYNIKSNQYTVSDNHEDYCYRIA